MAVVLILVVAEIIREGQERQKAEAEKRQVQRPLGQVKQSETVDKSTAPKEVILSNKQIVPAKSVRTASANANTSGSIAKRAEPTPASSTDKFLCASARVVALSYPAARGCAKSSGHLAAAGDLHSLRAR